LNDLDGKLGQCRIERLRPSRRAAILGILLQHNEVRDRLECHQADLRMKGLVLTYCHLPRCHPLGKRCSLLLGDCHHGLLQGDIQLLLATVGRGDECREPTELQKLTHRAYPRTGT